MILVTGIYILLSSFKQVYIVGDFGNKNDENFTAGFAAAVISVTAKDGLKFVLCFADSFICPNQGLISSEWEAKYLLEGKVDEWVSIKGLK